MHPQPAFIATSDISLVGFRKSLASKGISDKPVTLISGSKGEISISSYESHWPQWAGWCGKREIDPFRCSLKVCFRLFIYYSEPLDGLPIGQSPLACSLLSSAYNQKPPSQNTHSFGMLKKSFCYLKLLPADNLSDKELTFKLTVMLVLTATSRCSEISYLNINFMAKTEGNYIFSSDTLTKAYCRSKSQPTLSFQEFEHDKSFCVFSQFDTYIERSESWRQGQQNGQLLSSFVEPHNGVVKSTKSRWIKKALKQSGINVERFEAHSARFVFSSKAQMSGLRVEVDS